MEYALIWHSQYGKEEVDTTTDTKWLMEAVILKLNDDE